ncbi:unnamed protein product [Rotaria sp. Silwood2]|nr:unnamed protein product [Rotaria sp. Silwood2]CAF4238144.1 unnamed protein product [Rotaria sp. Silwood2]
MFGCGFPSFSLPLCSQSMMSPFNMSMAQPYCMSAPHAVQPVMAPTPVYASAVQAVPVPMERPCAMPIPHPVPVLVDRPCAVPVPVPVPVPVQVTTCMETLPQCCCKSSEKYYTCPSYRQVEYIIEEPVCIRRRRPRRQCRSYSCSQTSLPPIIIPIPIQAPAVVAQQPPFQVTEYVQDIYPPAQVFTDQVPVGYTTKNIVIQQPGLIQNQGTTINCQPSIILSSAI